MHMHPLVEYELGRLTTLFSRHYNGQREQVIGNDIYYRRRDKKTKTNEMTTLKSEII